MAVETDPPPGVPEWVVTFGDMMSLLLTFFIMLVSMSEIKTDKKVKSALSALQRQFGRYEAAGNTPGWNLTHGSATQSKSPSGGKPVKKDSASGMTNESAQGTNARMRSLPRGQHATVGGVVFFEEFSAELSPKELEQIPTIANSLGGKPQKIEIRGHTTARPIQGPFRDRWELAYHRSHRVMEELAKLGIDPKRFRLSVAGENEPSQVADDPALLKDNSRVEIIMLDELVSDFQGSPEERGQRVRRQPTAP